MYIYNISVYMCIYIIYTYVIYIYISFIFYRKKSAL